MKSRNYSELAASIAASILFLATVAYLTQCAPVNRVPRASVRSPAVAASTGSVVSSERRAAEPRSETGDNEEQAKIKGVVHVLQTIGANPELRRTYGLRK